MTAAVGSTLVGAMVSDRPRANQGRTLRDPSTSLPQSHLRPTPPVSVRYPRRAPHATSPGALRTRAPPSQPTRRPAPHRQGQTAAFLAPVNATYAAIAKNTNVSGSASAFQASWTTLRCWKKTSLKPTLTWSAMSMASPTSWPR